MTTCTSCGVVLPFPPEALVTCPRCAPRPDVVGRIAAELIAAAFHAEDASATRELLAEADAWRRVLA